jgi:uncharacterized protein (DUF2237 family)
MKTILKLILLLVFGLIITGYYINSQEETGGEKLIGFGVLIFAFVLMPLFIYHRYNGRDLSRYSLKNMFENINKKDKS